MTIKELMERLEEEKINKEYYSINGKFQDEKICIEKNLGVWEVYYKERGSKSDLKVFNNENDACEYLYCTLKDFIEFQNAQIIYNEDNTINRIIYSDGTIAYYVYDSNKNFHIEKINTRNKQE